MRRRTFSIADSPTTTVTLRLYERDALLGEVILRWTECGVGVEVLPGSVAVLGSFRDVCELLSVRPDISREAVVAALRRFGFEPAQ